MEQDTSPARRDRQCVASRSHLDLAPRVRLDEDVLRLEVAVYEPKRVDVDERLKALLGDGAQPRQREVGLAARLAVVLGELVQVIAQKLAHNEKVLLVVERVVPDGR
eukprot:6190135-Pleurochrysis_carterae.AAC.1